MNQENCAGSSDVLAIKLFGTLFRLVATGVLFSSSCLHEAAKIQVSFVPVCMHGRKKSIIGIQVLAPSLS